MTSRAHYTCAGFIKVVSNIAGVITTFDFAIYTYLYSATFCADQLIIAVIAAFITVSTTCFSDSIFAYVSGGTFCACNVVIVITVMRKGAGALIWVIYVVYSATCSVYISACIGSYRCLIAS